MNLPGTAVICTGSMDLFVSHQPRPDLTVEFRPSSSFAFFARREFDDRRFRTIELSEDIN